MSIADSFPEALLVLHDHRADVVDMVAYSAALHEEACATGEGNSPPLERDRFKWKPHPEEPREAWRPEGSATDVLWPRHAACGRSSDAMWRREIER
jgi:hypothetical protein